VTISYIRARVRKAPAGRVGFDRVEKNKKRKLERACVTRARERAIKARPGRPATGATPTSIQAWRRAFYSDPKYCTLHTSHIPALQNNKTALQVVYYSNYSTARPSMYLPFKFSNGTDIRLSDQYASGPASDQVTGTTPTLLLTPSAFHTA
jgi:hypothetical protein